MMRLDGRRLLRALTVGGLCFLLAGGGVGLAMAATQSSAAPSDLSVPLPRPGDRAVYHAKQVILDEDNALGFIPFTSASFEWLPERTVVDADAGLRYAHPLHATYNLWEGTPFEESFEREMLYDATTGALIFEQSNSTWFTPGGNRFVSVNGIGVLTSPDTMTELGVASYREGLGPCGFSTRLQGSTYLDGPLDVAGNCDWPQGAGTVTYQPEAWVDNVTFARSFRFHAADTGLDLLYSSSSPFPTRMQSPMGDLIYRPYTVGRMIQFDLKSLERGTQDYPVRADSTVRAGPGALPLVPRPSWGIDDSGLVGHPFPLSAAYQAALAETDLPSSSTLAGTDPTVSEFMADYPRAYLAYAQFFSVTDAQGGSYPEWALLFSDGTHQLGKIVTHEPVGAGGFHLPTQSGQEDFVYDWHPDGVPATEADFLPSSDPRPADAPTAQGLMQRFADLEGKPANGYGFTVRCHDMKCHDPYILTWGALAQEQTDDAVGKTSLTQGLTTGWDATFMGQDGRLYEHDRIASSRDAIFPLAASPDRSPPTQQAAAPPGGPIWVAPTTAAATGLSFLGLLAGVLYYFWPAVKALPGVGLFSRIEPEAVLNQPTRAMVHTAIESEPGLHFQALSRKTKLGNGVLEHHLRKLEAAGLILVKRSAGYTCYFPKGMDRHVTSASLAIRSTGSRAVLGAVAQNPGASSRDLAARLGVSPSNVSYHLRRLQDAGLVSPDAVGARVTELGARAAAA